MEHGRNTDEQTRGKRLSLLDFLIRVASVFHPWLVYCSTTLRWLASPAEEDTMELAQMEFLCVRCARHTRTCCQRCEVYVTPGDVRRIAAHTGTDDFHEFRPAGDPSYADQDDDPTWKHHVFRADGTRRVLKRRPAGDCTFLGPHGCRLPLAVRPLICRIYPYDYTAEGLKEELSRGCPMGLVRPGLTLIDELGMNRADAERWHRQLYDEVRAEERLEKK
jgi:Fe-S-cluster containining protein